jgi:hypothetical protein
MGAITIRHLTDSVYAGGPGSGPRPGGGSSQDTEEDGHRKAWADELEKMKSDPKELNYRSVTIPGSGKGTITNVKTDEAGNHTVAVEFKNGNKELYKLNDIKQHVNFDDLKHRDPPRNHPAFSTITRHK